jgi:hypothetical protein
VSNLQLTWSNEMDSLLILTLFKKMAENPAYGQRPSETVVSLASVLARTHGIVGDSDWEAIASAGALLWRAQKEEIEASTFLAELMRTMRRGH